MPRRSADALAVVRPVTPPATGVRLAPPAHLSEGARAAWNEITQALPAGYFSREQAPMLEVLAHATAEHRRLCEWLQHAETLDEVARLSRLIDTAAARISTASTRLRLTAQSRYTPRAAVNATQGMSYADRVRLGYSNGGDHG